MANSRSSTNGLNSDGSLMNVGNHIWDPATGGHPSVRLFPEYSSGSAMAALLTDERMGLSPCSSQLAPSGDTKKKGNATEHLENGCASDELASVAKARTPENSAQVTGHSLNIEGRDCDEEIDQNKLEADSTVAPPPVLVPTPAHLMHLPGAAETETISSDLQNGAKKCEEAQLESELANIQAKLEVKKCEEAQLESELASIQAKLEVTETSANPVDEGGSVFGKRHAPRTVTCYICGKEFGHSSITIHEKQCARKWEEFEAKKPRHQRRSLPHKPTAEDCNTAAADEVVTEAHAQQENSEIAANSDGGGSVFGKRHAPRMVTCYICGKGFGHSSIKIHEKQCARRWEETEAQKPRHQQRPLPQRPKAEDDTASAEEAKTRLQDSSSPHEGMRSVKMADGSNSADGHTKSSQEQPESSMTSANGHDSVFGRRHAPRMVTCYICGKAFGHSSIKIHEKQCARKWEETEAQKPRQQRRPLPQRPREENHTMAEGMEDGSNANSTHETGSQKITSKPECSASTISSAHDQAQNGTSFGERRHSHTVICYICGREFGHASIGIHEKQCAQKWEKIEAQKPVGQRRPLPPRLEEHQLRAQRACGAQADSEKTDDTLQMIRMELAASDWCLVHKLFTCIDADSSGCISHDEFLVAMRHFGRVGEAMEYQVDWTFERMDKDQSGDVDFAEFLQAVQPLQSMFGIRQFQKILTALASSVEAMRYLNGNAHLEAFSSDANHKSPGEDLVCEQHQADLAPATSDREAVVPELKRCETGNSTDTMLVNSDFPMGETDTAQESSSIDMDLDGKSAHGKKADEMFHAAKSNESVGDPTGLAAQRRISDKSQSSLQLAQEQQSVDVDKPVYVYTEEGCSRCRLTCAVLEDAGIICKKLNINVDKSYEDSLFASGFKGGRFQLPIVLFNGEALWDFDVRQLPHMLQSRGVAMSPRKRALCVYGADNCSNCAAVCEALEAAGFSYEQLDAATNDTYEMALYASGFSGGEFSLPVVTWGLQAWWDMNSQDLLSKLSEAVRTQ